MAHVDVGAASTRSMEDRLWPRMVRKRLWEGTIVYMGATMAAGALSLALQDLS
jgi:hypothetical protein